MGRRYPARPVRRLASSEHLAPPPSAGAGDGLGVASQRGAVRISRGFYAFAARTAARAAGRGLPPAGASLLVLAETVAARPPSKARALVLLYRVATFYLPPIWGWFALQWLRRPQYL